MDDDGAPPAAVSAYRIGIAPTSDSALEAPEESSTDPAHPQIIRLGGGDGLILPPSAEKPPSILWSQYAEWRKSKCPERDLSIAEQRRDDLNQATHELVGEVAELGELFIEHGPAVFYGDLRTKLIDECGDIFFCACWALDAWGCNPLGGECDPEIELVRVAVGDPIVQFTEVLASRPIEQVQANPAFVSMLGGVIFQTMLHAQTFAGLTANSCKKQVYQGRPQDIQLQVGRIINAVIAVNHILILANSSVEEALLVNQRKLNARFPTGWTGGGGIRTGEGR
jgi:hypothetical protein